MPKVIRVDIHIEQAAERQSAVVEIHWHPFQLNDALPFAPGVSRDEYLLKKFGSANPAWLARLEVAMSKTGINYKKNDVVANTLLAHMAMEWARKLGPKIENNVARALFSVIWEANECIGDVDVVLKAVKESASAGAETDSLREALDAMVADDGGAPTTTSTAFSDLLRNTGAELAQWRQRGVSSVPFIILNQHVKVSGAQPVEVFADLFEELGYL